MKKFIYVSDLKFGPDATKKQEFLFKADLEFAISEGYNYIQPKDGPVLKIINNNELVEVEANEEYLQSQAEVNPAQVEFDPNATSEVFKSKHELTGDTNLDGPFFDDVKKCFNQGISIIEDSAGFGYAILRTGILKDIYGPDSNSEEEELTCLQEDKESICLRCENKELIMKHINKVLQSEVISANDTDIMLNLAHLAKVLDGVV